MLFAIYGARGSVPVSGKNYEEFGGNTTCLQVLSDCIPDKTWLVVDAGSGIIPLAQNALKKGVEEFRILFTHYHHDHTQGLLLTPQLYISGKRLYLYGPVEHGVDPKKMIQHLMDTPYHPVSYKRVMHDITTKGIEDPGSMIVVVHREGGFCLLTVAELASLEQKTPAQIRMSNSGKYPLDECLVIKTQRSHHPEYTISYRFEERCTGEVFVLLTDHENTDGLPAEMAGHLDNADVLVMDCQYTRKVYDERTAGFGHATPDYCVWVAKKTNAKRLYLTHHDPFSTDEMVREIRAQAQAEADRIGYPGMISACHDFMTVHAEL